MKIVFAGGGTGGHVFPAIALAQEIRSRIPKAEILFIGTRNGIERKLVPENGFRIEYIQVTGLQRKLSIKNLLVPYRFIMSLIESQNLLKKFKPDIVVGTGGYVSGPVLYMAAKMKIPTLIQEQNSYPGITTRQLAKRVDSVHIALYETEKYLPKVKSLHHSGNPLRSDLTRYSRAQASGVFGFLPSKKTLLIFGGSQGARRINRAAEYVVSQLLMENIQIIWQTGIIQYDEFKDRYRGHSLVMKPFFEDMAACYAASDLAICRAGALTLAELALVGLPAILIPFPYATADHQKRNAEIFVQSGAAMMITEDKLDEDKLLEMVKYFLDKPERLKDFRESMLKLAKPDATRDIVNDILKLAGTKN